MAPSQEAQDGSNTSTEQTRKNLHKRSSSRLMPTLNSLGSFLASAGGLNGSSGQNSDSIPSSAAGCMSADAELVMSHPRPTEWADDASSSPKESQSQNSDRDLGSQVHFRGQPQAQSSIAFPSSTMPDSGHSIKRLVGSRTSSSASTSIHSPGPSSSATVTSSSTDTPATSVRHSSPSWTHKDLPLPSAQESPSPPPPSEATVKPASPPTNEAPTSVGLSRGLSAQSGASDYLSSADEKPTPRQLGLRARSINSIRGLAAAFVPARFVPGSSQASGSSASSSADESEASHRRRDGMALVPAEASSANSSKALVREGDGKRPVKLDRRRLDKAVSLAVEAAQAAEEDERLWEEKRRSKHNSPKSANGQLVRVGSESDESDQDDDDLGFSLDLYISSLGYLISAISDKEAPGLSPKQRQDMKQRLEEGMSKLGFDAKAELQKAEEMKRELELERAKLDLQLASPASTANVVHHHYHTTVSPNSSIFGAGDFSRAHAAAKASGQQSGRSSLAGKLGSTVLDVGLHIGAGALSALSANLAAIAPKTSGPKKRTDLEDPRITDLDDGEELLSSTPPSSQPASGAATPRTAWNRSINQNNKQWELAVAFASTAASALASSLGAVARSDTPASPTAAPPTDLTRLTPEQQAHLVQYGTLPQDSPDASAEDKLILLSASLARSLKRSPLPTQLYALLRQLVSILAAIDAKYSLTEKGTQLAVQQTSRALRFVRKHDLHVKAVRVAWAAAEAAVAALEAYRDEKGYIEAPQQGQGQWEGEKRAAIMDRQASLESQIDDAEAKILRGLKEGEREKVGQTA